MTRREDLASLYISRPGEVTLETAGRETGEERFKAMSKAEQDAALGVDAAAAVRSGKVRLKDLRTRDDRGRIEQRDDEDVRRNRKPSG